LIHAARTVNDAQPHFVLKLAERALGSLKGKRIAALGLAYKPDVDDLRESPAVDVVKLLAEAGAVVRVFEPFKPDFKVQGAVNTASIDEALQEAEAVILLVNHASMRARVPQSIAALMPGRVAIDTVNGWDSSAWQSAGFQVYRLGVNQ
jgi:UDP-N-acetyl-D-mannosaminuronic acid dehydrogenase